MPYCGNCGKEIAEGGLCPECSAQTPAAAPEAPAAPPVEATAPQQPAFEPPAGPAGGEAPTGAPQEGPAPQAAPPVPPQGGPGMPPPPQPYQGGPGMPPQQPYQGGPGMPPPQQPYQGGPGMPPPQQPYQGGPGMPPPQQPYQGGPGMPPPPQPYQGGPGMQPQQPYGYGPQGGYRPPNPMVQNIFGTLKRVFSPRITDEMAGGLRRTDPTWIVWALLSCLINGLFIGVIMQAGMAWFANMIISATGSGAGYGYGGASLTVNMGMAAQALSAMGIGFGKCFLLGALYKLVEFFVMDLLLMASQAIAKRPVNFMAFSNLVAVATIPSSAILVVALLVGMLYAPLGIALAIVAESVMLLMIYAGLQKAAGPQGTPTWVFIFYNAAYVVVMLVLFVLAFLPSFTGALSSMGSMF